MQLSHRFGRVDVRPIERQILVDGAVVAVGARAFDVLMVLIERRDRLVTKDELLDAVWPGVVVEENNLAVQVHALRRLIGPQVIATIPGRGYRFAAALEDDDTHATAGPPPGTAARRVAVALAAPGASLVGRDEDLAALLGELERHRLVTLLGAGGIGKTALALAAARAQPPDTVAWVELADIEDAKRIPAAVAQAAGITLVGADDPVPALVDALRSTPLLLVLDNAEHLLAAVAVLVRRLADGAPRLRVLVTSQAPLRIDGEQQFRLGALSVPASGASAAQALAHGAVALFVERAKAASRGFALTEATAPTVTELCRRLDGVPLAIRLAAARLPSLGLGALAERLADGLSLLRQGERDAPPRHRTLRAALDWSHGLLRPQEQAVFRRLAVFAGSFPLGPVGRVAGGDALDEWAVVDALAELTDRCLVTVQGEPPRYRLPETAREYARARLDAAGERDAVARRHAEAMADAADAAYEAFWHTPDAPWLDAWAPEIDNLRAALDWGIAHDCGLALRLAGSTGVLFMLVGLAPQARLHFAALEAAANDAALPAPAVARYWLERSRLHWNVSNEAMLRFAQRAAECARASNDSRGLYLAMRCAAGSKALPPSEADSLVAEMAALQGVEPTPRLHAQLALARIEALIAADRLAPARVALESLLPVVEAAGLDGVVGIVRASLCELQLDLGDADGAALTARTLLDVPGARKGNWFLPALAALAHALLAQGRHAEARAAIAELAAASRSRDWEWFGLHAGLMAWLAAVEGRAEAAACLDGFAIAAQQRVGGGGMRSARVREAVAALLGPALDAAVLARLREHGAQLDAQVACAMGLAG